MLLRDYLEEYTKEQLLNHARTFELKRCSGLRKAELIERIIEYLCAHEILRGRLACLTKEQMNLFRRACEEPQNVSLIEVIDSMQLCRYWIGSFEESTDRFSVFEELKEAFREIDDEEFRLEQYKKGWMMKCVNFFIEYYGIAPLEVIHKMYKLKVNDSIEDMIDTLSEMPIDILEACIYSPKGFTSKNSMLYSDNGLLIHLPMIEEIIELRNLLKNQGNKDFYIPSAQQIEEICMYGYEFSSLAYKKLEEFFRKKLNLSYEHATTWCLRIWANSCSGGMPSDIISEMTEEEGIEFNSKKQMNEFLQLLMDAHNNTRMKENRGHNPKELSEPKFSDAMPIIVPGSSQAAEMLRDAMPQLSEMGFSVDLDKNADTATTFIYPKGINDNPIKIDKKIYPNDPCPCGSGKKYKKCCGRKYKD
ncbi:MAG: SEC-C metal-binding domain-containing protein [Eubacteriales bacterium]|nr:SEC-C metal-binding domain-containing protein [Eubacteriales bacterium]